MTEQEWLACASPDKMLAVLRGNASNRKLRLFALACIRPVLHHLWLDEYLDAVEVAERYLEGLANEEEYLAAKALFPGEEHWVGVIHSSIPRHRQCEALFNSDAWEAADAIIGPVLWDSCKDYNARHRNDPGFDFARDLDKHRQDVFAVQASLLRDIFGPFPYRSVALDRTWLTSAVKGLAESIYADRAFENMPILADALEDAGCDNQDILVHCRQPGGHCRGCWLVDLVLGKE
jgi:hypothetical protein